MFCENCGAKLYKEDHVCEICGEKWNGKRNVSDDFTEPMEQKPDWTNIPLWDRFLEEPLKVVLVCIPALLLCVGGVIVLGNSYTKRESGRILPEREVESIVETVTEESETVLPENREAVSETEYN